MTLNCEKTSSNDSIAPSAFRKVSTVVLTVGEERVVSTEARADREDAAKEKLNWKFLPSCQLYMRRAMCICFLLADGLLLNEFPFNINFLS